MLGCQALLLLGWVTRCPPFHICFQSAYKHLGCHALPFGLASAADAGRDPRAMLQVHQQDAVFSMCMPYIPMASTEAEEAGRKDVLIASGHAAAVVLTGVCYSRALVLSACTAYAADSAPRGSLLIPKDEKDFSSMLSALMEAQHFMLQKAHGVDSPQVALSTSLLALQSTVRNLCTGATMPAGLPFSCAIMAL